MVNRIRYIRCENTGAQQAGSAIDAESEELDAASDTDDVARFLELSSEFTRRYPQEAYGFAAHATALMENGRYADATATAEHAVKLGYEPAFSNMMRFQAYNAEGRTAEAIQECTTLARNPEVRFFALFCRAKLLLDLNDPDHDQALTDANEAVALSPEANTYGVRAQVYWSMGLLEKCIADYSRAIQLDGSNADFLINRATVYEELGKDDAAQRDRFAAQAVIDQPVVTSQQSASVSEERGKESPGAGSSSPLQGIALLPFCGMLIGLLILIIGIASEAPGAVVIGLLMAGSALWWFVWLVRKQGPGKVAPNGVSKR